MAMEASVNTTKTAERVEAELKEEERGEKNPQIIARLKVDLAELKLKEERQGNNDPLEIARLKVVLAELDLKEERLEDNNPQRIARLEEKLRKAISEENAISSPGDKGEFLSGIFLLERPCPLAPHSSCVSFCLQRQNSAQIRSRLGASSPYQPSSSWVFRFFQPRPRPSEVHLQDAL